MEASNRTNFASDEEKRQLAIAEAAMNFETTEFKGITIPSGFAPTRIEGESTVDEGLVIVDSKGNEFVWVEVPKVQEIYKKTEIGITEFTDDIYTKIEEDLQNYASFYRFSDPYNDTYYDAITATEVEYNNLKQRFLRNVYENGGFWIGRYEAGTSEFIEDYSAISPNGTVTIASKANQYPLTNVTFVEANQLAFNMYSNQSTSLMFGVQWDLTLKFIEEKQVKIHGESYRNTIRELLTTDSSNIGNYSNAVFTLNRGKYIQFNNYRPVNDWKEYISNTIGVVEDNNKKAQEATGYGIMCTTGASDNNCLQNIYDLAGNVWEFTIERWAVRRGGSLTGTGARSGELLASDICKWQK
ncbi:MAG: hypothetical protein IJ867_07275 [Clostridia bacterium]|nr:hypothetical protein [Clostridia bacterium]